MRKRTRICAFLLLAAMCAGVTSGCAESKGESAEEILTKRREIAESYMRAMATVMWRAQDDVVYTLTSDVHPESVDASKQIVIQAGRLYRGIPYSYAMGSLQTFLDFGGEADAKGVVPISGLRWESMSGGGGKNARIGNDCSSAVILSWSQIGASVIPATTQYMCPDRGYLRVGEYTSKDDVNLTVGDCMTNGAQVMYEAYAKLQKADAVVRRGESNGHAMMIVGVEVVRKEDGTVDGSKSKVTVLEQTRQHIRNGENYYDETYGEAVFVTFGVDVEYSFQDLFGSAYLPITCKELIDPAPIPEPAVQDSEKDHGADKLFVGEVVSNRFVEALTISVTDGDGKTVGEATAYATRGKNKNFALSKFLEDPPGSVRGTLPPETLPAGNYHCTLNCRLTTGQVIVVRDFDFTV